MRLIASLFVVGLIALTAAGQNSGWREFRSDEGRFSVLMPGEPTASVVTVNVGGGDRHSNTVTYSDNDLNEYMVAYSARTGRETHKTSDEQLFDDY